MMAKLWGEIPSLKSEPTTAPNVDSSEITNYASEVLRSIPREFLVFGAELDHEVNAPHIQRFSDAVPCQRTLHTIKLLDYCQKYDFLLLELQDLLEIQQVKEESEKNIEQSLAEESRKNCTKKSPRKKNRSFKDISNVSTSFEPALPIPELPTSLVSITKRLSVKSSGSSDFAKGVGKCVPMMNIILTKKILQKSVATIFAHAGFETTSDDILDFLTDIADNYFATLCQTLKSHSSSMSILNCPLFPGVLQCALKDMRISSFTTLSDFYEKRVIYYHQRMVDKCGELRKKYEDLRQSENFVKILESRKKLSQENNERENAFIVEEISEMSESFKTSSDDDKNQKKKTPCKRMKTRT